MLEICKILLFISITAYMLLWMNSNKCSQTLQFVFWLIFLRFVLASFYEITYPSVFSSFSIISIYSLLLVGLSVLYMYLKKIPVLTSKGFYGIKIIIFLMLLSSFINNNQAMSIASILKWVFLLQLSIMLIESIKFNGGLKVFKVISIAYLYPVSLVLLSVIFNVSKATEVDGSISYVGGYYHEAVISVIVFSAMCLFILMFAEQGKKFKQVYLITFFWFLLMMINYRTTLLASLFIGAFVLFALYKSSESVSNRSFVLLFILLTAFAVLFFAPADAFERFQEVPEAISQYARFLTFPEYYSIEERRFFSGRIYLWSHYISNAIAGTNIQILFGQGMDSWKEYTPVYAHNTFVSFFYELGVVGLLAFGALIVNLYRKILQIRDKEILLLLCGIYTSFLVLNLGTMPLWQLEGGIFFSLIIAVTESYLRGQRNEHRKKTIY